MEQHEFCFDAVLDEDVSNDEVLLFSCLTHIPEQHSVITLKIGSAALQICILYKWMLQIQFWFLDCFELGAELEIGVKLSEANGNS